MKGTIEWYNRNAQYYADKASRVDTSAHIDEFVALLPKGAMVLDAGCGSGRDTKRLSDRGLQVQGIDISTGLLEVAKKSFPDLQFVEGDLRKLPFRNETFDGIWVCASLLHLETVEDVEKAFGELHRILRRGGVVYGCVKQQLDNKKTAVVSDAVTKHDRFFQYFTLDEVQKLLVKSNFEVTKTAQDDDLQGRPEVRWILFIGKKK